MSLSDIYEIISIVASAAVCDLSFALVEGKFSNFSPSSFCLLHFFGLCWLRGVENFKPPKTIFVLFLFPGESRKKTFHIKFLVHSTPEENFISAKPEENFNVFPPTQTCIDRERKYSFLLLLLFQIVNRFFPSSSLLAELEV